MVLELLVKALPLPLPEGKGKAVATEDSFLKKAVKESRKANFKQGLRGQRQSSNTFSGRDIGKGDKSQRNSTSKNTNDQVIDVSKDVERDSLDNVAMVQGTRYSCVVEQLPKIIAHLVGKGMVKNVAVTSSETQEVGDSEHSEEGEIGANGMVDRASIMHGRVREERDEQNLISQMEFLEAQNKALKAQLFLRRDKPHANLLLVDSNTPSPPPIPSTGSARALF